MKFNNDEQFLLHKWLLIETYNSCAIDHYDCFVSELKSMMAWAEEYGSLKQYGCEGMMSEDYTDLYCKMIVQVDNTIKNH